MFHRIPSCFELTPWNNLLSPLRELLSVKSALVSKHVWKNNPGNWLGSASSKSPKGTAPFPLPKPTCPLKVSHFCAANTISPTFPANFTDSPDQNPEPISSLKLLCVLSIYLRPLNSLEHTSLLTSLPVSTSFIQVQLPPHSYRTSYPLSLNCS